MHIVVFGANGHVGHRVVALLLERGHTVRAFVHSSSANLPRHSRLEIVTGDACNKEDVVAALRDMDAAVNTLSSWRSKAEVLSTWTSHVTAAVPPSLRIVSVTGSAILRPGDQTSWYDYANQLLLRTIAPRVFRDGARHIDILAASQLDWRVLRSPVMRTSDTTAYQLSSRPPLPWQTISYDAVATAIVDLMVSPDTSARTPFITPHSELPSTTANDMIMPWHDEENTAKKRSNESYTSRAPYWAACCSSQAQVHFPTQYY